MAKLRAREERTCARGRRAEAVRDAITRTVSALPEELRRSPTWDEGAELAQHDRRCDGYQLAVAIGHLRLLGVIGRVGKYEDMFVPIVSNQCSANGPMQEWQRTSW